MPIATTAPRAGRRPLLAFLGDAETEAVARRALADLAGASTDIQRGTIERAMQRLANEPSPEVLIVDLDDVQLPASEMTRLAEVCDPGISVIALGSRNDVSLYRQLLRAGIADYLVKPLTEDLLRRAVTVAMDGSAAAPIDASLGKVVAVFGTRGGVGTTTLACNLAWHLAERQGRRTALLDLDLGAGDCALLLDVEPTGGLRQALEMPHRIDRLFLDRSMARRGDKLHVLSAEEPFGDDIPLEIPGVESLIRALQAQFHYVVVDIPRIARRLWPSLAALAGARMLVADATLPSLKSANRLHRQDIRPTAARTFIVLNRYGEYGRSAMKAAEFAKAAPTPPSSIVPFEAKLALATDTGVPAAARGGAVAEAVAKLAGEISGQPARPRRWWRIFS